MPAVSKKQQKFFGMVRATQKGEMKNPSKEILDVANDISMKDAKKFAKTKHKGLPEKKKMNEDNVLKKVAKQLDGASKMHKQQANKVRKHIKDMHKEGMYDTDPKTGESPVATSVRKGNKKKGDDRLKHFAKLAKKMVGEENIDEKCWKGYEKKGMKTMFGKRYPNCVKKEEIEKVSEATTDYGSQTARDNDDNKAAVAARKRIYDRASEKDKNTMDARTISQQRNKVRDDRMKADQNKPEVDSVGSLIQKKLKVGKFKKMNEDVKRDEYGDPVGGPKISKKQKAKNLSSNTPDEQHTTTTSEAKYEVGASTYGKASIRNKRKFGTKGENPDPLTGKKITKDATRGELIDKRREEHKAKRGVKEEIVTESDKKGKGSGKKDACYHKVKASASVWPSAYASGRLVQCRKKGAANYGNSKKESYSWREDFTEGSLHKWFKGSKSKDGKGGWVNVVTGGTCASDEPGEGTPKCVSSSKRASMTKAERLSASRRKKKADPGQQSKSGAAKPTYVSTDKPKKKMKEEIQITEADKKGKGSGKKDACYHKVKASASVWPSAYASGRLVQCRKKGAANYGNSKKEEVEIKTSVQQAVQALDEVSKKTLGSYVKKAATEIGTSAMKGDYKKMQKRHKGVLDASDKLQKEGAYMGPDKKDLKQIKKMDNPSYAKKLADYEKNMDPKKRQALKDKATKGMKFTQEGSSYGLYKGSGKAKGAMKDFLDKKAKMLTKKRNAQSDAAKNNPHFDSTQPSPSGRNKYEQMSFQQFQEKCWAGYEKKGMKTMFGKRYPNCVKKK